MARTKRFLTKSGKQIWALMVNFVVSLSFYQSSNWIRHCLSEHLQWNYKIANDCEKDRITISNDKEIIIVHDRNRLKII